MVNPFLYMTLWSIFFVTMEVVFSIKLMNIHLLTLIVSVFGFYITYVLKTLVINEDLILHGSSLRMNDLVFHHLLLLYVWVYRFNKQHILDEKYTIVTILFVLVYMSLIDVNKVYGFQRKKEILYLMCVVALLYILLITLFVQPTRLLS